MAGFDLGKQIGPLPLGAWLAVVGTGLGVALYTRSESAAGGGVVTDDGTGGGGLYTDGGGSIPGHNGENYVGTGGWTYTPPSDDPVADPDDNAAPEPTDNDQWGRLAINRLIADGYDPATSQSAIGKALQGVKMSISEYALWGIALAKLGSPPYPVDVLPPVSVPGPVTPTPTPTPTPAPVPMGGVWYVTKLGSKLGLISSKFYGDSRRWDEIWRANAAGMRRYDGTAGWLTTAMRNPSVSLPIGKRLWIPRR